MQQNPWRLNHNRQVAKQKGGSRNSSGGRSVFWQSRWEGSGAYFLLPFVVSFSLQEDPSLLNDPPFDRVTTWREVECVPCPVLFGRFRPVLSMAVAADIDCSCVLLGQGEATGCAVFRAGAGTRCDTNAFPCQ